MTDVANPADNDVSKKMHEKIAKTGADVEGEIKVVPGTLGAVNPNYQIPQLYFNAAK